ncbi:zinc finger protein 92-like [Haliotis rubra]|uniref:zinc finger protein 92-like n=1 Tax=Haliotis rubra TaxID=36100 RepID=UPI001EE5F70C|nr:zinc finger protein 92-like [Haliotis rubra]
MICERTFHKKVSLENHKRSCWNESTMSKPNCHAIDSLITDNKDGKSSKSNRLYQTEGVKAGVNKNKLLQKSQEETLTGSIQQHLVTKRKRQEATKPDKKLHVVEEIWIHKQPGRPSEKVKSNRVFVKESDNDNKLHCLDSEKLSAIIDEAELKCQKCGQEFTSVSNLRRHAIRHLGWKRFKCKLCRFSSYNKSECNTHIMRTHSEKYRLSSVESLIVDLNRETSRIQTQPKLHSLNEKQTIDKQLTDATQTKKTKQDKSKEKDPDPARKFNISTRNSPRNFDTRPYQKCDNMTTLFTRKGYYPKPYLHIEGKDNDQGESQREDSDKDTSEGSKCMGYSMRSSRFTSKQSEMETEGININSNRESSASQQHSVMECSENEAVAIKSDSESFEALNENCEKVFVSKGRRKVPLDSNFSCSHSRREKSCAKSNFQHEQRKTSAPDMKSQDFLAPWPRASEPMSVKEMFALIRRSPRAGTGRRKSTGDITICQAPDTNYSEDVNNVGVQSVATARSSKVMDGKVKLSATLARKSSPGCRSVPLNQRTSRPGVDWSQNSEEK